MLAVFLNKEKTQLPCWIPVLIGAGILIEFNFNYLNSWLLTFAAIAIIIVSKIYSSNIVLRILLISIFLVILGMLSLKVRINTINSPTVPFENRFSLIYGKIENITPLDSGYRVILSDLKIKNISGKNTPKKIRLMARTKLNDAKIGSIIEVNAILSKPMGAYLPDGYNFARDAFFKEIGAVGYSVSDFKIIKTDKSSFLSKLNILRNNIQARVNDAIGSYNGSIATALMINEYSNIDKEILKNLRATGLAHILSVSGMHLTLVAAIFFFSSRFLLNCFEPIALRINCKKFASFIALIGSLAYLLISGMEIAAIRAFIMTASIILAIILDRTSNPMRAIAFAATIILIFNPEAIIHPSFQMSFAAVLALISCFEFFKKIKFDFSEFNIAQKILFYILSLCFSSLVAGLATSPFALYHFGQSSNYSILANLIAVPITSFWLMPCVVLTFLLYPFHLEILSLYPMQLGITLVINVAHYIANLPHSVSLFAKITNSNILIISIGMIWFCIWHTKIRLIGILIILLGIILQSFVNKPDIFVDWQNKNLAILDSNKLVFLDKQPPKFKKQLLMNHFGVLESLRYNPRISKEIYCYKQKCILNRGNYRVNFNLNPIKIEIIKNGVIQELIEKKQGIDFIYLNDRH